MIYKYTGWDKGVYGLRYYNVIKTIPGRCFNSRGHFIELTRSNWNV